MKNSIIKYDRTDFYEGYSVTDYTSKKLSQILDFSILDDSDWIEYYILTDNETIEQVSYDVYGTTMYWDVILYINKIDPLFGMVYDFDFSRDTAESFVDNYNENVLIWGKYVPPRSLPTAYMDMLKDIKTEELEALKELKRPIKIIRHNKILDFMKLLRQQEII